MAIECEIVWKSRSVGWRIRSLAVPFLLAVALAGCGSSSDPIGENLVAVPWAEFGGFYYAQEWAFRADGTLSIMDRQDASLPWRNGTWDLYGNRLTVHIDGNDHTFTVAIEGTKMEWIDTSSGRKRRFDYIAD